MPGCKGHLLLGEGKGQAPIYEERGRKTKMAAASGSRLLLCQTVQARPETSAWAPKGTALALENLVPRPRTLPWMSMFAFLGWQVYSRQL